jgi:GntR family transcriptional repressor for pyruvate dehydrogenase complex
VRRARPEQRRRILTLAVDGSAFEKDPMAFRLLDLEFHQQLNAGAGNPVLSMVAQNLYDIELDVRRRASELPGVIAKSVSQHVEIAEAVRDGREDDAVAAARAHLEHVRDCTLRILAAAKTG